MICSCFTLTPPVQWLISPTLRSAHLYLQRKRHILPGSTGQIDYHISFPSLPIESIPPLPTIDECVLLHYLLGECAEFVVSSSSDVYVLVICQGRNGN